MAVEVARTRLWDIVLRDGSTLTVRPAVDADNADVLAFFDALSDQSRYFRFLGTQHADSAMVGRLIAGDPARGASLVGVCGGRIAGFAGFYRSARTPGLAEVAFAISDGLHGRGVGTRFLELLADLARAQGIDAFEAYVHGDNRKMMDVFVHSGCDISRHVTGGVFRVSLSLAQTPTFAEKSAHRSEVAATASMQHFFEPRVVAVVGANRERGKIGGEVLHNLIDAGFTGRVVPVHPTATEIEGLPVVARVSAIEGPVDLAVIAVPAAQVLGVVEDCIAKGVPALCVISAGFSEAGAEGRAREAALLERVRAAGCRVIGPNCMGLLNADPAFRLNATFSPVYPPSGSVAMSTQSGALGLAILDYAQRLNIGISHFVSVGNKVDVSGNDLLQYWATDPRTAVILLYLESFGNPKKFSEIARRVGQTKPIVAVKSGRSHAGARAASSHTGALATSDAVVEALFRQAGVIRADTLEELFDVAALLANQPIPTGRRVAILTNAGGPAILAADACEARGLALVPLSDATHAELRSFLPAAACVDNPVDMIASASADHYERALIALLRDDNVDSVLTIFIPPLVTAAEAVARAIKNASEAVTGKTLAAVFMGAHGAPSLLAPIPCYAFPESAARALAHVTTYGAWRRTPLGTRPRFDDIVREPVRAIVDQVLRRGGGWLTPDEAQSLLQAVGIAVASARVATSAEHACAAAAAIGYPVVLKALGPTLLHKSERRAVVLDLRDAGAVRAAFDDVSSRFGSEMTGVLVQRLVPEGVEMIVGAVQDPNFGPLIACGSGGVLVELLGDSAFRLHPLTSEDAGDMIDGLRGARLLRGFRGAPALDEAALRNVLLRVSALLTWCPEIQELDINPLKVLTSGVCALDVRVRVGMDVRPQGARRVQY